MFTVWRVQDKKGRGPYSVDLDLAFEAHCMSLSSHPGVDTDFFPDTHRWLEEAKIDKLIKRYKFGFLTKEDALNWFGKDGLELLAKHKFKLVELKASVIVKSVSGLQCAFIA